MVRRREPIDIVREKLAEMVGQTVTVTWSSIRGKRNGFHLAVSVSGKLEKKDPEHFRVVASDDAYAYFGPGDVDVIVLTGGFRQPRIMVERPANGPAERVTEVSAEEARRALEE